MVRIYYTIFLTIVMSHFLISQNNQPYLNPYVNKSELYWLKTKNIDLSKKSISNKDFINDIRMTLDYKSKNRKTTGKLTAVLALFTFTTIYYATGEYETASGAFRNTLMGTISITSAGLATKYLLDLNTIKTKQKERLKIAQEKYKLFMQ